MCVRACACARAHARVCMRAQAESWQSKQSMGRAPASWEGDEQFGYRHMRLGGSARVKPVGLCQLLVASIWMAQIFYLERLFGRFSAQIIGSFKQKNLCNFAHIKVKIAYIWTAMLSRPY